MLVLEPLSSKAVGSRSTASLAVVRVRPVTMVAPADGVTWNPVGCVSPLKCRYFVLTSSSIASGGVSTPGQSPSSGTPRTKSPGPVTSAQVPAEASNSTTVNTKKCIRAIITLRREPLLPPNRPAAGRTPTPPCPSEFSHGAFAAPPIVACHHKHTTIVVIRPPKVNAPRPFVVASSDAILRRGHMARSALLAWARRRSTNIEVRIPKQARMTQNPSSKHGGHRVQLGPAHAKRGEFRAFGLRALNLFRVSCFGFRVCPRGAKNGQTMRLRPI